MAVLAVLTGTATLIKAIRAERGDDAVLLLDGGDTWQGSYTSLKTQGADMVSAMKLLKPDCHGWPLGIRFWSRPG